MTRSRPVCTRAIRTAAARSASAARPGLARRAMTSSPWRSGGIDHEQGIAKAGIQAYCRAIAVEYGRAGIRANAVCPGSVRTPAWDHRLAKDPEERFQSMAELQTAIEVPSAPHGSMQSPTANGTTSPAVTTPSRP